MLKQWLMPSPRHMRLLVKIVEGAPVPQAAANVEVFAIGIEGDGVGGVGLQLDRIGTAGLGRADDVQRVLQLAVVVGRHFGNDIRGGAKANLGAVNLHMDRIHVYFSDDARPRGRIR